MYTSGLDESAIVVDTLLQALVLTAVVDDERLATSTAVVLHGIRTDWMDIW